MNCKPGDMARVIYSDVTEAIGAIVLVEATYIVPPYVNDRDVGHIWACRTSMGAKCITLSGAPVYVLPGDRVICPDAWLRPIRPGELDDTEDTHASKPNETVRDIIQEVAA